MATLKELTWEFHKSAERSDFARKLLKGQLTEKQYAEYLFNQHYVYNELENWARYAGILKGIEDICRTEALNKDMNELGVDGFTVKESAKKYAEHLYKLADFSPEQLLAHIYVRHFGDLHGGQMIRKRVPGSGAYYEFHGKEKELIAEVRSRLEGKEELFVDEAIECFKFATELFKELSSE